MGYDGVTIFPIHTMTAVVYLLQFFVPCLTEVWKGSYRGTPVAVKTLKEASKAAQTFLKEAQLMTQVLYFVNCATSIQCRVILTEYVCEFL